METRMANHIIAKEIDSETMLYNTERDELHVLNAAAQLIYNLSREGKSVTETAEILRSRFKVPPGQNLENEIEECLKALRRKGLLIGA